MDADQVTDSRCKGISPGAMLWEGLKPLSDHHSRGRVGGRYIPGGHQIGIRSGLRRDRGSSTGDREAEKGSVPNLDW